MRGKGRREWQGLGQLRLWAKSEEREKKKKKMFFFYFSGFTNPLKFEPNLISSHTTLALHSNL
jgi:hypothetical protein